MFILRKVKFFFFFILNYIYHKINLTRVKNTRILYHKKNSEWNINITYFRVQEIIHI